MQLNASTSALICLSQNEPSYPGACATGFKQPAELRHGLTRYACFGFPPEVVNGPEGTARIKFTGADQY